MSERKLFAVSTAVKKTLTQMSSHQNNCCCCVRTYVHPQSLNTSHSCCLLIQPSLCFRSLQSLLELINRQDIVNYIPAKISNGFGAVVVGSVGRAVASNTRGPWFKSSHRQKFIYILNNLFTVNCVLKRRK